MQSHIPGSSRERRAQVSWRVAKAATHSALPTGPGVGASRSKRSAHLFVFYGCDQSWMCSYTEESQNAQRGSATFSRARMSFHTPYL
jgi:hypothetical protein